MEDKIYKLYRTTDPAGKIYFGITGQSLLSSRVQNGRHYENNKYITQAYVDYPGEMRTEIIGEYDTADEALIEESFAIVMNKTFMRECGHNIQTGKSMMKRRFPRGYIHKETNQFFFTLDDAAEEFNISSQCISTAIRQGRACKCGEFVPAYFDCVKQEPVSDEMFERLDKYWQIIKEHGKQQK